MKSPALAWVPGCYLLLLLLGGSAGQADDPNTQPQPLTSSTSPYVKLFTTTITVSDTTLTPRDNDSNVDGDGEVNGTLSTGSSLSSPMDCPVECECDAALLRIKCTTANASALLQVPNAIPPQVQYLKLQDNNNRSSITELTPHAFHNLKQLTVLDLSSNEIQSIHPDCFIHAPRLQEINLHGNLLNETTLALSGLPGLQVLNVSNNRITDLDTALLDLNGTSLRILDAGYNLIHALPNLQRFPSLRTVILKHNQIKHLNSSHQVLHPDPHSDLTYRGGNISSHVLLGATKILTSNTSTTVFPTVTELDLSANDLKRIDDYFFTAFPDLHVLDLSHNHLEALDKAWSGNGSIPACSNLWYLDLSHNAFMHLPNDMFAGCCPNLTVLHVSYLPALTHINSQSFVGLTHLYSLDLQHNPQLYYIHAGAFSLLTSLNHLNLSFTGLESLHGSTFDNLASITSLDLTAIRLQCSCDTAWLGQWDLLNSTSVTVIPSNLTCDDVHHSGDTIPVTEYQPVNCSGASILTVPSSRHVSYEIGASARFDCLVDGKPAPYVTWVASKSQHQFTYHSAFLDHSELLEPSDPSFHQDHYWHASTKYFHDIPLSQRIFVLKNGSLYIDYVTREDAGKYKCLATNHLGNESLVVTVTLDYHAILETQIWCLVIGLGSAISFLLLGLAAGLIRWVAHFCSPSEKEKRRSIRELLATIQEYKTEKVDVFRAYKTAKLDKISAFKNHKIDKLRVYKQGTVTNILQHMHSMREHYQGQMSKIKDNYNDQVNRLRDNYTNHINKIKDFKAGKVERVRDNYQTQALKIRDYGSSQMQRLREQYKLQQQHMLKLLELLDIGNCMSVIEAECMRTESMLFDPNITFDLDANPVHVPLPTPTHPTSDDSEYITAGSLSDVSAPGNADNQSPHKGNKKAEKRLSSSDNSDSSYFLDHSILTANLDPVIQDILRDTCCSRSHHHRPHRRHRKKRKRNHSAQCHSSPPWMGDDEQENEETTAKPPKSQQQKVDDSPAKTQPGAGVDRIDGDNVDDDDNECKDQKEATAAGAVQQEKHESTSRLASVCSHAPTEDNTLEQAELSPKHAPQDGGDDCVVVMDNNGETLHDGGESTAQAESIV